jgi:hypothetical protein
MTQLLCIGLNHLHLWEGQARKLVSGTMRSMTEFRYTWSLTRHVNGNIIYGTVGEFTDAKFGGGAAAGSHGPVGSISCVTPGAVDRCDHDKVDFSCWIKGAPCYDDSRSVVPRLQP